jgi:glycosyltransferase involved in cell wall biosynthesis
VRIAWVTPFVLRSSIGRVGAEVTRELAARGHAVEIVRSDLEDGGEALHPTDLPCRPWCELDLDRLAADFDLVIVNIGDNYLMHAGVFPILAAAPCLAIVHDFYLYNLFAGWLHHGGHGAERHDAEVVRTYGPGALDDAIAAREGRLDLAGIAERLPMTEWIAARCGGALAHARFYAGRLEAACPGPVTATPLCCPPRPYLPPAPAKGDRLVVTTVGVMNPNKRAEDVIIALSESDALRERTTYRLVGPIEDAERARLTGLAQALGFYGLAIDGAVDDAALDARLAESDIIVCLRKPVLEGASGSAIEGMLSGRPTVVADAGFYGELPDDLVFKIDAAVEIDELRAMLERLAADRALRLRVGKKARAWALATLGPVQYVDALEPFAQAVVDAGPLLSVGERLGRTLSDLSLGGHPEIADRIGAKLQGLFAPLG